MRPNSLPDFENTKIAFASKSNKELKKAHFIFSVINRRIVNNIGIFITKFAFKIKLPIKKLVKETIFSQFCGGETVSNSTGTIEKLAKYNIGAILDYSVERTTTEKGFEETEKEILHTIDKAAITPNIPFSVFKVTGVAAISLLEKKQKGEVLTQEEQNIYERVRKRVDDICKYAYEKKVRVFIDAEETWIQDVVDELTFEMMRKYNKKTAIVYNTYQLYVAKKLSQFKKDFETACKENYFLGAKIVRGAYMEKERERAANNGYSDPIHPNKEACNKDFNLALEYCVENIDKLSFCAGTHNEKSNFYLAELLEKNNIPHNNPNVYFAQLYGMSEHISYNLASENYNVAKYLPYGSVEAIMPYLMRRAEENTSIFGQSSRELTLVKKEIQRRKKEKR